MPRIQIDATKLKPEVPLLSPQLFLPSGSTLLDLVNGGGWGIGSIVNIVGDKSSGKTLLAIEACANFARLYGDDDIRYAEAEAAFNIDYARSMGLPIGVIPSSVGEIKTVEDFAKDFQQFLSDRNGRDPCLYILDSLDALSDDAEAGSEIGTATYGTKKARMMSEMFRRYAALANEKKCLLIIISQIRDKIGVTFGETKTRSGGRALDFYASQIVWLVEIGKVQRTLHSQKRVVGVNVLARNRKNKLGLPFREAEFELLFQYGIADEQSMLDWLKKHKAESLLHEPLATFSRRLAAAMEQQDRAAVRAINNQLADAVAECWYAIEEELRPPMRKYS